MVCTFDVITLGISPRVQVFFWFFFECLRQFKNNMFMCFHPFYGNVRLFQGFRAVQFFF